MIRLNGNTILIADSDRAYGAQLKEVLKKHGAQCFVSEDISDSISQMQKYDFDLVISNYYLSDGIIFNLIDWGSENLSTLPIFTCTGYPLPGEIELSHKHAIANIFSKSDQGGILQGVSNLLFDFQEFHENLLEMMAPSEIMIEVQVGNDRFIVQPLELTQECIFFQIDHPVARGSFGVLKFSLEYENQNHNFVIPGCFEGASSGGGQIFRINKAYQSNWAKFLKFLSLRQVNITAFLKKASGL